MPGIALRVSMPAVVIADYFKSYFFIGVVGEVNNTLQG